MPDAWYKQHRDIYNLVYMSGWIRSRWNHLLQHIFTSHVNVRLPIGSNSKRRVLRIYFELSRIGQFFPWIFVLIRRVTNQHVIWLDLYNDKLLQRERFVFLPNRRGCKRVGMCHKHNYIGHTHNFLYMPQRRNSERIHLFDEHIDLGLYFILMQSK